MAQSYTRQSTFSDGDTITAALFNNEYNQLLNAFSYSNTSASSTGHRHDGTTGEGGNIHTIGDLDFKNKIVVDSTNNRWGFYVEVSSAAVEQIRIQDGAMIPVTDSDVDLGTSSLYWKDAYIDSVTTTGNIAIGGNLTVTGNATISGNLTFGDADTDSITLTADVASHITPDADSTYDLGSSTKEWRDIYIDGTAYLDAINFNGTAITATAAELNILDGVTATASELNILDGVTSTTAELNILDGVTSTAAELNLVDGSSAGTVVNSKAVIYGSSGEVKGTTFQTATNTSGNLLIANGTGFASTAVGDLSEISTIANDDVLLAVDTSGGGLKKVTRSTLTAGLVSGSEISNVVEDTTPQLGGDLDMNGQDIVTTSNADLELAPNGTGHVTIKGNTNSGAIQFNCESNSHGQIVKAQPHSAGVTNELLLPAGGNSTLVSEIATQTLTNKRLTSPKINEDVVLSATATELNVLDGITSSTAELNILDGVTSTATELNLVDGSSAGTIVNSKAVVYGSSGEVNATTLQIAGTSITSTAAELNILDGVTSTAAELNILDGVTSTAAELNILDGVTATTAELNYLDITTLGLTEASKAVTADANGVVSFDNGTIDEVTSITSSSNAATINLRDGNVFEHDLTENVTYTFSNPAASGRASVFVLKVIQDSSARTITWPGSVDWAAATAPTLTATNNGVDVFVFVTIDGGTTYYGFTAGQALA